PYVAARSHPLDRGGERRRSARGRQRRRRRLQECPPRRSGVGAGRALPAFDAGKPDGDRRGAPHPVSALGPIGGGSVQPIFYERGALKFRIPARARLRRACQARRRSSWGIALVTRWSRRLLRAHRVKPTKAPRANDTRAPPLPLRSTVRPRTPRAAPAPSRLRTTP